MVPQPALSLYRIAGDDDDQGLIYNVDEVELGAQQVFVNIFLSFLRFC